MPYGYRNRILFIDLSDGRTETAPPEPALLDAFIGGRGLGGAMLRPSIRRSWDDPLSPLIFMTGPLVDTASPTSGRMSVSARSPLTGTAGDASVGGRFGTMLKRAGFDGIFITGRADGLSGIEIDGDSVRIVSARPLAGADTETAFAALRDKGAVAVAGPAAENGVRFSCIVFDGHYAAGRGGLGLGFAARNLKYITVRGSEKTDVFDPEALKQARTAVMRLTSASPAVSGTFGISRYGTGALVDLIDARGMTPTANFRRTRFPAASRMNAHAVETAFSPEKTGCMGCHIRCKKRTADGRTVPEYETLSHFSALLENTDLVTVMAANRICNRAGMDTVSAAATLACHAEILERPLAPEEVLGRLEDIAAARGVGEALAQGSTRYAASEGRPEAAMAVKGQELPAYDPRGAMGMALAYAVATRGGCHLRAYPISHEILRKPVATDRFSFLGKARMIKAGEDQMAAADALTACKFVFFAAGLEEYAAVLRAVTGRDVSGQDLMAVGERIVYQERIMNHAVGFSAADDDLPRRFFDSSGGDAAPIDREAFLKARADYYAIRGLTPEGAPTTEAAARLGLEFPLSPETEEAP